MDPATILERAMDTEMISAQQLHDLCIACPPGVVLLDIRAEEEQRDGIIPGSTLFPCDHDLQNRENKTIFTRCFLQRFDPARFDENNKHILICRSGPRAAIALNTFLEHDLPGCELLGGILEWQRCGLSLTRPDTVPPAPAAVS